MTTDTAELAAIRYATEEWETEAYPLDWWPLMAREGRA